MTYPSTSPASTAGPGNAPSQVDPVALSALAGEAAASPAHRRLSQNGTSDRSNSPVSRINTPSLHHDPNIAPQHLFDGAVSGPEGSTYQPSPSLPALQLSHPSPSSTPSLNGRHLEPPHTYEERLHRENTQLRTRVSELEVVNMLMKSDLDTARVGENDLKRRISELEQQLKEKEVEPPSKKIRLSDMVRTEE
ncbi:MAG: hypothetical protein Q9227_001518 [Pyrenula ochraceoflavens]